MAVVLARPADAVLSGRVEKLLQQLKADSANGIAAIAGTADIARMGGNPEAAFYVNMAPDAAAAGSFNPTAPLTGTPKYKGTHGYFPNVANLQATFLLMGKGVPEGRSLGPIDMRAIAPTLAALLKIELAGAEVPPLEFIPTAK